MAETIIETPRLRLRTWDDADGPEFWRVTNTPAVTRHLGGVETDEERLRSLPSRQQALQAEAGHCFWIVERKNDRALLGFCGIKRVDCNGPPDPGTPEIGWRLREDAWGQGYAREAAVASMSYAFDSFPDFAFVTAFTIPANTRSWGLMERLGMQRRADLDYYDEYWGPKVGTEIVYRITRAEWDAKRKEFEA